jgi:hypothetical protein
MLRNDFVALFPAYKHDEVLLLNFEWVCEELIMAKERELISINTQALFEESEMKKNKR